MSAWLPERPWAPSRLAAGDRFSGLGPHPSAVADHVPVADVLDAWTRTLIEELDGVDLADLERGPTI